MARPLWAAALLFALPALAQITPDGGTPDMIQAAPAPTAAAPATAPASDDQVKREVQQQVEQAKKEMREELRAQMASQSASEGWNSEWTEEKRKLELFVPNGYLRVRPELFHKLALGWNQPDPSGYFLFPRSPRSVNERTVAGANMRFRFEPTINVSEEVRIKSQIDALDNLVLGSTPAYAYSRSGFDAAYGIFNESEVPPVSGINSFKDSIAVKRVWGEVSTPVGILRFGRMGSQWGLGMLHNDGNCLDCDNGDTVDRLMFVTEPLPGFYVAPAIDFNVEGPTWAQGNQSGQPFDLYNSDDAHSLVLVLARRDTDQQAKAKLEAGMSVFNYGLHFEYRTQRYESSVPAAGSGNGQDAITNTTLASDRQGSLYVPDLWAKFERRHFRIEAELAGMFGSFRVNDLAPGSATTNPVTTNKIDVVQFGGVLQGEYRLVNDRLHLIGELGFASGDSAPGFGARPGRDTATNRGGDLGTQPGDIDGPQFKCQATGGCSDHSIRNFRFNLDYRIDEILFKEIIGGITDAIYIKPTLKYEIADGFSISGSLIYSRAVFAESTPSTKSKSLGIEADLGGALPARRPAAGERPRADLARERAGVPRGARHPLLARGLR
jgi:uncharacterized protein (TIGR04551 family)